MANDYCAALFNDISDHTHGIEEVLSIVFLIAATENGHQLIGKINLLQLREEVIPVTLSFTIVPGWDPKISRSYSAICSLVLLAISFTSTIFLPSFFWIILATASVLPVSLPKKKTYSCHCLSFNV